MSEKSSNPATLYAKKMEEKKDNTQKKQYKK
jgi:hypothetical protein